MSFFLGVINLQDPASPRHRLNRTLKNIPFRQPEESALSTNTAYASFYLKRGGGSGNPSSLSAIICAAEPSISTCSGILGLSSKTDTLDSQTISSRYLENLYRLHDDKFPCNLGSEHAAFIWDPERKKLLLSTDRYGTQPIYYAYFDHSLIFSNEIAPLYFVPGLSTDLDEEPIADFLLFGKHKQLSAGRTPFKKIATLPPAGLLSFDASGLHLSTYWQFPTAPSAPTRPRSHAETLDNFTTLLSKAIRNRISGKRVLLALSGGVDSTTVASQIQRSGVYSPRSIRAFTVAPSRQNEEFKMANLAAQHLGISHELFVDRDYSLLDDFPPLLFPTENPFPQKHCDLANFTAGRADIVLTGGAADNLLMPSRVTLLRELRFAGFRQALRTCLHHRQHFKRRIAIGIRRQKTRNPRTITYPPWLNRSFERESSAQDRWERFWNDGFESRLHPRHPAIHEAMAYAVWNRDLGHANCFAPKVSRADPFFDIQLLHFILSLPSIPWFINKFIMRTLAEKHLPRAIVERKKTPGYDAFSASIKAVGEKRLNSWKPHKLLPEFIEMKKIEPIRMNSTPLNRYVNYRVIAFNRWLHNLDRLKEL